MEIPIAAFKVMIVESIPAPFRVIALLILTPVVQVHDPDGIATISPFVAAEIALFTAAAEQEAALWVAANSVTE